MGALTVVLSTILNTVIIAVIVRRLLGVAVGWPRTLLLSAIATSVASPPLVWALGWLGIRPGGASPDHVATALVSALVGGWVLALEISVLAVAEAIVPTGSLPGPVTFVRALPGWLRRTRRYVGILGIGARHGLIRYLGRSRPVGADGTDGLHANGGRSRRDTAVSLREALTDGGVTFVKLGQMLATRPDLLPARYVEELSRLHSQVSAEPWSQVAETLRSELGAEPDEVFASVEHEPLAAASVGQVHRAVLRDGIPVVVKVQRAGARSLVRGDLDIVQRLAHLTERRTSWARRLGTVDLATGFRRSLDEELDYRVELHNLTTLHGSDLVVIPRAHPEHSSRRVLTMELMDGVPLSRAGAEIAALRDDERRELAVALVDVVLHQVLVDGIFHADLHGGNVLLLADRRLALLDFGAVGRMDRAARTSLVALLMTVDRQDGAAATRVLARLMDAPEDLDVRQLEREVSDLVMRVGGLPVEELFGELFATSIRHGLRVPPAIAAAFRAIGALEGTLRLLTPGVDLVALARERAGTVAAATLSPQALIEEERSQLATALPAMQRLPEQVASVVQRLDRPNLGLRLPFATDTGSERFLNGLVQQVVLAVLAATSAACGTAMALNGGGPLLAPRLPVSTYAGLVLLLFAYVLGSRLVVLAFRGRADALASDDGRGLA